MKKIVLLGTGLCVALAFSSCKSSESAYKKAYEKARQQELTQESVPQSAPAVEPAAPAPAAPAEGEVRQEKVTVVSGNGLLDYSVVCGSFGVKANADNLKSFLDGEGYNAMVVFNADRNMYRVVSETFSTREEAARARDAFKAKYSNRQDFQASWLLYRMN